MNPQEPFFNPLTIPYLPETYFPYAKRSIAQRPFTLEMDTPAKPTKRLRIGSPPPEHVRLSSIKRLERVEAKALDSNACPSHAARFQAPIHVLKFLQQQGVTLNRTNEAMELLCAQVNSLTEKLDTAIQRFSPTQQKPQPSSHSITLLRSYSTIVSETLRSLKHLRTAPHPAPSQYVHILTALDSIQKLRDLVVTQCNFDPDPESAQTLSWPPTPGPPSLSWTDGRPTWDQVIDSLTRMERNLSAYLNVVGGNRPTPFHTSTPIRSIIQPQSSKKRKQDMVLMESGEESVAIADSRRKLYCKRVSFSFSPDDSMEVD